MTEQNKYILLEHLQKLAYTARADYVTLIAQALEGEIPPDIPVTLSAHNWSDNKQIALNEAFLADGHVRYLVCADADCLESYQKAGIMAKNVTETGKMEFTCVNVPDTDIVMDVMRLEVKLENE